MEPGAGPGPNSTKTLSPAISKDGAPPPSQGTPESLVAGRQPLSEALYRERGAIIVALKAQGYTYTEIAEATGLTVWQIRYTCRRARAANELSDVVADLSHRALPQAVENLVSALEDPKDPNHWKATEETLHGLGAFKSHKNNVNEGSGAVSPLQIAFIMQGGGDVPNVIVNSPRGEIGGTPRQDAE